LRRNPPTRDRHPETRVDLFAAEPFDFDQEYNNALVGEILPGVRPGSCESKY